MLSVLTSMANLRSRVSSTDLVNSGLSDQASAILSELPKSIRIEVVERIAKMDSASPEFTKSVEETLERKFAMLGRPLR